MTDPSPDPSRTARRPWRRRIVIAVGLAVAAGLIAWLAQAELVVVTGERNGEISTASRVLKEDDFHHPTLRLLRSREHLDDVVAAAPTQFGKVLLLRRWVRSQWEATGDFHYPPFDAVEILDLVRQHDNRGFCSQYSVVFLQACQSLGLHARYVDLPGHFIVAVWSDDYDRWVIMDPSNDIHYERAGLPMRGRDLYAAYWTHDTRGVEQVDSHGARKPVTVDDLAWFRTYSIDLAANQLTSPVQVEVNGVTRRLVHADDYRTYPQVGRDSIVIGSEYLAFHSPDAGERVAGRPETSDPDELRYAMNQTIILLANERVERRILKVALVKNNSSTFRSFLIRSESSPDWVVSPSDTVRWMLHPGANQLAARVETTDGWRGPESRLSVFYKPPVFRSLPAYRGNVIRLLWHRAG